MELSQTNFPRLWHLFQIAIGGTYDKRSLIKPIIQRVQPSRVLEVGCSVGNIADILKQSNCEYVGIDIDNSVIKYAQSRFKNFKNFSFKSINLFDFVDTEKFDLILFPAMFHHIEEAYMLQMIDDAERLLKKDGLVIINDPLLPREHDSSFFKWCAKNLEKGEYLRTEDTLDKIINSSKKFEVIEGSLHTIGASPISLPKFFHFKQYVLKLRS